MKKQRITLTIALVLSGVLVLLTISDRATRAEPPQRFGFATGVVTPAAGQTMRITINAGAGNDTIAVRFRWQRYMAASCTGMPEVCSHTIESQGSTPVMTLSPNEALSFDMPGNGNGVNVIADSNGKAVAITSIIDNATGDVVAGWKVEAGEK